MRRFCFFFIFFFQNFVSEAQNGPVYGAYYFDGWTGLTNHITEKLIDSFPTRKPVWGWRTSTPKIIYQQIDIASRNGLDFFSFCWYYSDLTRNNKAEPRNNALELYLKSKNNSKLKFNILVANHEGYSIGPSDWDQVSKIWVQLFKKKTYLSITGKPLITFFSYEDLLKRFGTVSAVKQAFISLNKLAVNEGLPGIEIAACVSPSKLLNPLLKDMGFTILTGYNYHEFPLRDRETIDLKDQTALERSIWTSFRGVGLPYIPVVTLNWDRRPWTSDQHSPRFIGFSPNSVFNSVVSLRRWIKGNGDIMTKNKIAMIYAWNEYGEGAYLTPTSYQKDFLIRSFKKALKVDIKY